MTVQEYVEQLLAHMGLTEYGVNIEETDDATQVTVSVPEDDSGMMIGKHGETIAGLQRLTSLSMQDTQGEKRVVVNVNDYLERRKETLLTMANRAADRVRETQHPVTLTRLKPGERRIVHMALLDDPDVTTQSEGEGLRRVLVIYPAVEKKSTEE